MASSPTHSVSSVGSYAAPSPPRPTTRGVASRKTDSSPSKPEPPARSLGYRGTAGNFSPIAPPRVSAPVPKSLAPPNSLLRATVGTCIRGDGVEVNDEGDCAATCIALYLRDFEQFLNKDEMIISVCPIRQDTIDFYARNSGEYDRQLAKCAVRDHLPKSAKEYCRSVSYHGQPFTTVGLYAAARRHDLTIFVVVAGLEPNTGIVSEIIGAGPNPVFLSYSIDEETAPFGHFDIIENATIGDL